MRQGRSLTDWAAEIERQAQTKRDFVVDSREMALTTIVDREVSEELPDFGGFGASGDSGTKGDGGLPGTDIPF